ncbi:hypothetical protein Zmor_028484 [Zophobas morio]|uniref:Ig-like domain-containing protein n=1 Tax=Zophobas morio TaxID=2755281 RepID=A0AA38M339_9CUCU|nr:hypothetical protein Zmor_028484 [Zophobas morio]
MDYARQILCLITVGLSLVYGQQQYFRVQPRDVKVREGGEAMLECEVANLAGQVQWAKEGFTLGFWSVIPSLPRHSVIVDRRHGIFNLRVSNVSLEDDAKYECQVGPARSHKAIRARVRLNVISPPSSVEILDHRHNSTVEIKENEEFHLECRVRNAKPAAKIVWYRGNVELNIPNRDDQIIEVTWKNWHKRVTRYDTHSRISLKPTAEDDQAEYTCEARHEALSSDIPMRTTVQLSVFHPPGLPYIEGYTEAKTIRRGQTVELACRSRGGNPPAQLIWYKNDKQIRMAYKTAARVSKNVYTFTADASDNKARYKCESSNIMSKSPLRAEVDMTVLFSPARVTISGKTEAKVGDLVTLTCTTANSNPPAEMKWMVAGRQIRNATSRTVASPEGGWITTSNITAVVEPNRTSLVVTCHGLNMQLRENVVSTHTINVLYPPNPPFIHGYRYTERSYIPSGTMQKISCTSYGGNPLATLTWYKNDKKINSIIKTTDKSVTAEITIVTNVTDNKARYRCEAANSAIDIPLFEDITMNVYFPPDYVTIRKDPVELKPNEQATLTCDSGSSNPPAKILWWRDGILVQGLYNTTKAGLHGGTVSTIELKLNITEQLNGIVYTCQATNEALRRSALDTITLQVLYKPVFDKDNEEAVTGVEGEPLIVSLKADGSPQNIAYTWTKDGLPIIQSSTGSGVERIISDGPVLNITRLSRHDAGTYTCEAINSQGSSVTQINIAVQYEVPPSNSSPSLDEENLKNFPDFLITVGGTIVGTLLIIMKVLLIGCFLHRRSKKRISEQSNQTCTSATIELCAPNSHNDTVTGVTLSSVNEKSATYSNEGSNNDYVEDGPKQPDYPGAHPVCPSYEPQMQPNMVHKNHTIPCPHHHHQHETHDGTRARDNQSLDFQATMTGN